MDPTIQPLIGNVEIASAESFTAVCLWLAGLKQSKMVDPV